MHALSCFGLFRAGTEEQKRRWLPDMLAGELLGAYCLSEAHAPATTRRPCGPGRSAKATTT